MNRPTAPHANCLAIVLAAGEGTRMRSSTPKVLHSIGGRSLIAHVLGAAIKAGGDEIAVVVGPGRDDVAAEARKLAPQAQIFEQRERLGTAHAVLAARKAIEGSAGDILVMFADTPLVRAETLTALRAALRAGLYELQNRRDVPARVVVSEYADVAAAFVERDETGMVNAVLDQLARKLRAEEFA